MCRAKIDEPYLRLNTIVRDLIKKRRVIKISFYFSKPQIHFIATAERMNHEVYKVHAFKEVDGKTTKLLSYPVEIRSNKKVWVDNKSGLPSPLTKAIGDAIDKAVK